ncbi:MAG: NHL repeat-containing protein [Sandaracinus sp.]
MRTSWPWPPLVTVAALAVGGCSPTSSIDASLDPDAGTDAFVIEDALAPRDAFTADDAFTGLDAAMDLDAPSDLDAPAETDAFTAPDASSGDGGFLTSLACPAWLGLPGDEVTLPNPSPEGIRLGPDCGLYVAAADTIYRIEEGTGAITAFSTRTGADLQGVEMGTDGRMYVTDRVTNSVLRFDLATGAFVDVFASTGLDGPNTPRFGPDGRLYVSCRNTANVVRFEADGTLVGEFATHALLASPEGISFGPDRNLYVAARIDSVVMRFDGATGAFLDQITATPAFMAPENIAFAPDGSLWIASRDTREVLRFDAHTRVELERLPTLATERPVGMEIVAGHLVVGMRGTGRVVVMR